MKRRSFLAVALAMTFVTALAVSLCEAQDNAQKNAKLAKVLVYTRSTGFKHDPAKIREDGTTICGEALKKYFADKNVEIVESQDGSLFDKNLNQYDAFVFYTCGTLTDKGGENDNNPMTEKGVKALFNAVKRGKGFVAIHSGCDTEGGWKNDEGVDVYTAFVGARFAGHGPSQFATVTAPEPVEMPWIKANGGKDTAYEEWYTMHTYAKDIHVVLAQNPEGLEGREYRRPTYPSSWIRAEGNGRVAYCAYGHDNRYWQNYENVGKVAEFIEWSIGRFDMDTTPNIAEVTPGANEMPRRERRQ